MKKIVFLYVQIIKKQKIKNKKDCKFEYFRTKKTAENYFIAKDKNFKYCSFCNK